MLDVEKGDFFQVRFYIAEQYWNIYIDDEYGDFDPKKQLLCIYLVLRALEDYEEASDYLQWCLHHALEASDSSWLSYFRNLTKAYDQIKAKLGAINSFISSLDYQLRSGAFAELVEMGEGY